MEVSGEVAELVVKEGLELSGEAVKLAGQGVISAAALVAALASDQNRIVGKASVTRLAKENSEIIVVPLRADDLKAFDQQAKRYGILYGETHFCRNWFHHETHLGGVLLSDYPCMACVTEDIQIGETPVQIVFPAESAPSAIEDIRAVLFAESCIYSVQKNCKKT